MDHITMHTFEHMFSTYIRNSGLDVIYFGPMGCQTGFYLLMRDTSDSEAYALTKKVLKQTVEHSGGMFGAARKECGNYKNLDIDAARAECAKYLCDLEAREKVKGEDFSYDKN